MFSEQVVFQHDDFRRTFSLSTARHPPAIVSLETGSTELAFAFLNKRQPNASVLGCPSKQGADGPPGQGFRRSIPHTGARIAAFHRDAPARCCVFANERRIVAGDVGGGVWTRNGQVPRRCGPADRQARNGTRQSGQERTCVPFGACQAL